MTTRRMTRMPTRKQDAKAAALQRKGLSKGLAAKIAGAAKQGKRRAGGRR